MKTIYKIARTELKVMFFSPIAWFILVIFAFQAAITFAGAMDMVAKMHFIGWGADMITENVFSGITGMFTSVHKYIFLYIPLLTMGVMSREFSSGSIKLLYSSPLTSSQIVLGKFLSLLIYVLVLMGILLLFVLYSFFTIKSVDAGLIFSCLLGMFLLAGAFAAVGLFMSSLTSYTVVSAMGTLGIFALMGYVRGIGQEIKLVRDITYWLSINGRAENFLGGLITTEDVLYFIIVIGMFLSFTIIRMQGARQKKRWLVSFSRYSVVFLAAVIIGYISANPYCKFFYDTTNTKINTLAKGSLEVMSNLGEDLSITTYTNMLDQNFYLALPAMYKYDVDQFKKYIRFKPGMDVKYEYYYRKNENKMLDAQFPGLNEEQLIDTLKKLFDWNFEIKPFSALKDAPDLESEGFRFVRSLKTSDGKQTFLRVYSDMLRKPTETEITAAFKRLALQKLPTVGFLTGHGERKSDATEDRGYNMIAHEKTFRYSLVNQGFDFEEITLDKEIPAHIRILVIAEVKNNLTPDELEIIKKYIDRGGNCIIAGEPGRQDAMNPITEHIGVTLLPGTLVKQGGKFQSSLLLLSPSQEAEKLAFHFKDIRLQSQILPLQTAAGLSYRTDAGFDIAPLFSSDSTGSWLEQETTNFNDDSVVLNVDAGEVERSYPAVLALARTVNGREQKIIVTGDADFLSNGELMMSRNDITAANFYMISGMFFWLTDGELPADLRRPVSPDNALYLNKTSWAIGKSILKWVYPSLLMLLGMYIWVKRKRR